MKKTNASVKSNELISVLTTHFQGKINRARIKLMGHFIIALCKVRTVTFEKLANAFECSANSKSSLRRIQRFMATYDLDADLIARLVYGLLPKQEQLILSIDRTNWKFGQTNINSFMLGIVYKGVAYSLLCLTNGGIPVVKSASIWSIVSSGFLVEKSSNLLSQIANLWVKVGWNS